MLSIKYCFLSCICYCLIKNDNETLPSLICAFPKSVYDLIREWAPMILSLQWICATMPSVAVVRPRPLSYRPPQGRLANLFDRPGDRVLDCGDREGGAVSCSNRVSDIDEGVAQPDVGVQQGRIYIRPRKTGVSHILSQTRYGFHSRPPLLHAQVDLTRRRRSVGLPRK